MPSNTERLTALIAQYAYREGDFTLASGAKSTFYLDAKQVTYRPEGVEAVGAAVFDVAFEFGAEAVGGLTMGADAIVLSTVWASVRAGHPVAAFVVRKEAKKHGLQKWIEGVSPKGKLVAIIDDVITSGGSVLQAIRAAQDAGATVAVAIALVDRQEGGAAAIEAAGVPCRAVCTLAQIRAHLRSAGVAP